jgi:hypothetical protein
VAIRDPDGTVREIGLEEAIALLSCDISIPAELMREAQNIVNVNAHVTLDAWRRAGGRG